MTNYSLTPKDAERFWAKVNKGDTCWEWAAYVNPYGYGQFSMRGANPQAHRIAWMLEVGPIPEGQVLDHICRNTLCVNPGHLRVSSHKQNHENLPGAYANSSTGVLGVQFYKRTGRYKAEVRHWGRNYHVGYFDTVAQAEGAVIAKRLELFTHNEIDKAAA